MRLYVYLGKELLVYLQGEPTHPYKAIIENYASEMFEVCGLSEFSWFKF